MKIISFFHFIYYRLYRFSKLIRAFYPDVTAAVILFLIIQFPIIRIIVLFDSSFFLIFAKDELQFYKIIYYVICLIIGSLIFLYFNLKKKYQKIEQEFKAVKVKTKRLTDILLIIYLVGLFLSFFLQEYK